MIVYRPILAQELVPELFRDFIRHQVIDRVWRKEEGGWVIRSAPRVIENWGDEQRSFVCWALGEILAGGGIVTGAFSGGKLKGIIALEAEPLGSRGQYREIPFLQVSGDCRGQGIGTHLFTLAREQARALGAEKLYLSSNPCVESQAFYRAMGCREAQEYSPIHTQRNPLECQIECGV